MEERLSFLGLDFSSDRPILSGDDGAFLGKYRVLACTGVFQDGS